MEAARDVSLQFDSTRSSASSSAADLEQDARSTGVFHGSALGRRHAGARGERILVCADEVKKWVDEGVFYLVSPLDSANMTEVELTEEQESLLSWLDKNQIAHVRVND